MFSCLLISLWSLSSFHFLWFTRCFRYTFIVIFQWNENSISVGNFQWNDNSILSGDFQWNGNSIFIGDIQWNDNFIFIVVLQWNDNSISNMTWQSSFLSGFSFRYFCIIIFYSRSVRKDAHHFEIPPWVFQCRLLVWFR